MRFSWHNMLYAENWHRRHSHHRLHSAHHPRPNAIISYCTCAQFAFCSKLTVVLHNVYWDHIDTSLIFHFNSILRGNSLHCKYFRCIWCRIFVIIIIIITRNIDLYICNTYVRMQRREDISLSYTIAHFYLYVYMQCRTIKLIFNLMIMIAFKCHI